MSSGKLDFDLYVITDRHQAREPLAGVVEAGARSGRGRLAFQLREKDLAARALFTLASQLLPIARAWGSKLLVNDRVDVALAAGADGAQLARHSLPASYIRSWSPHPFLLGVSVHGPAEAAEPESQAADFLVLGPIFATPSKARYGQPLGLAALEAVRQTTPLPLVAVGGIRAENAADVIRAGADAVAVIAAVMGEPDAAGAVARLLESVDRGRG
ncbi:MAG: thiamine phosphate synthase [Planctomycetes bacterium]|nr:thiamine phosphate synthase [Planctomycetota bacterium]